MNDFLGLSLQPKDLNSLQVCVLERNGQVSVVKSKDS